MIGKSRLWVLLVLVVSLGTGCASLPKNAKGPVFTPTEPLEGKAVVHYYRPSHISGSASTVFMSIPLEANNCFAMVNGGYYSCVVDPGKFTVGVVGHSGDVKEFSLDLKPGDSHYVRVELGSFALTGKCTEVPASEGREQIAKTKQISVCR